MPQNCLDVSDIRTAFEQERGGRVSDQMARAGPTYPRSNHVLAHQATQPLGADPGAAPRHEQVAINRYRKLTRTCLPQVALDPPCRTTPNRHVPVTPTLPAAYEQGQPIRVEVLQEEPRALGPTDRGGIQQLQVPSTQARSSG